MCISRIVWRAQMHRPVLLVLILVVCAVACGETQKGHKKKAGDEIARFNLPNESDGDTKVFQMQIRTSGGQPVTECYQIHATNLDPESTTIQVTWHKRDGSGNEDPPETLKKDDEDSEISECHCNDAFDQAT